MNKKIIFLIFTALSVFAEIFITKSYQFIVYDLTESKQMVSLVGPAISVAFIVVGVFAGTIVDAFSRRFFIYLRLYAVTGVMVLVYALHYIGYLSVYALFALILINAVFRSFGAAAEGSAFYDTIGDKDIPLWVSRKSILTSCISMFALFGIGLLLDNIYMTLLFSGASLMMGAFVFSRIGYVDGNEPFDKNSDETLGQHLLDKLKEFARLCRDNPTLSALYGFAFIKTVLIYWPMSSGALFKFGVENVETQRLYLYVTIAMDITTIVVTFILGKGLKIFTLKTFLLGVILSGVGIIAFGMSGDTTTSIISLAILYIGLAFSNLSNGVLLRTEIPEEHRAQGLAFSVVPYYTADFVSGIVFAILIPYFTNDALLQGAGWSLVLACVLYGLYARKHNKTPTAS